MYRQIGALFLTLCLLLTVNLSLRQPTYGAVQKIVKDAIPATVFVVAVAKGTTTPKMTGSGVVISSEGHVVSNFHVIGNTQTGEVLYDMLVYFVNKGDLFGNPNTRAYRVKLLNTNYKYDLVLGKITEYQSGGSFRPVGSGATFPFVNIADSNKIEPTDSIYALGFPAVARLTTNMFSGITVLDGKIIGLDKVVKWIKTNAEISPGNSGGPSIDMDGALIGINSAVKSEERTKGRISLIRPINLARHLAKPFPAVFKLFKDGEDMNADKRGDGDDDSNNNNNDNKDGDNNNQNRDNQNQNRDNDGEQSSTTWPITGFVRSADSQEPIGAAVCVIVKLGTRLPLKKADVIAYGRSDDAGKFTMNNRVKEGRYTFIAAHNEFRTISAGVGVNAQSYYFTVTMARK